MKKLNSIISLLLVFIMVLSMSPVSALADEIDIKTDASGSNQYCEWSYVAQTDTMYVNSEFGILTTPSYMLDEETRVYYAPFFYNDDSYDIDNMWRGKFKNLVIGKDIFSILSRFYEYGVENVSFENGSQLSEIRSNVFKNTQITEIELPDSLTYIGANAFENTALRSITIPENVSFIGACAFMNSTDLVTADLSKCTSLDTLCMRAFYGCASLENVMLSNSVKTISSEAFRGCEKLLSVTATGVTTISDKVFYGCMRLNSISFGNMLKEIGESAFYYCEHLTAFDFENTDTDLKIGKNAFNKAGLRSVVLPASIKSIGAQAFLNSSVRNLVIKFGSATKIDSTSFSGMTSLESVDMSASDMTVLPDNMFKGDTAISNVVLPDTLATIGKYCFSKCNGLTNLDFLKNVSTINSYAFAECEGFVDIDFSGSKVTTLDSNVFRYCSNLETVNLGNAPIKSMGDYNFEYCTKLTTFNFGSAPTETMGRYNIYNCRNLDSIDFGTRAKTTGTSTATASANLRYIKLPSTAAIGARCFTGCSNLEIVDGTINNSVGNQAFYRCTKLKTVTFGSGCTTIGSQAFAEINDFNCSFVSGLTTVGDQAFEKCVSLKATLPNTVKTVGKKAFENTAIEGIGINITSLGDSAFSGCTKLTSVIFSGDIKTIPQSAFSNCTSLSSVTFRKNTLTAINDGAFSNTQIKSFTLPSPVTVIGANCFSGCTELESFVIPANSGLVTIGDNAFYSCTALESLNLPENAAVKTIGSSAFAKSGIKSFVIPQTVTKVGDKAFNNCLNLGTITVNSRTCTFGVNALGTYSDDSRLIRGYKDSTAEIIAQKDKLSFAAIDEDERTIFARSGTWGTNCTWNVSYDTIRTTLTITGTGDMTSNVVTSFNDGVLTIPEICKYYNVNYIVIEAGVTSIPDNFLYFDENTVMSVKSISIPYTVNSIGAYAFANCPSLTKCSIPKGVTEIKEGTFIGSGIITMTIPDSVTAIGRGAFAKNDSLTEISIYPSCTSIYYDQSNTADCAFGYLSNGSLNKNLKVFCIADSEAYAYAKKLRLNTSLLEKAATENGTIGTNAKWSYYEEQKTLYITPDSYGAAISSPLKYLGGLNVQEGDLDVEKIVFNEGVYIIDGATSYRLNKGRNVDSGSSYFEMFDPKEIVLPSTLKIIDAYAFKGCKSLEYIRLPENLETISNYAFAQTGLKYVTMPDKLTNIKEGAFYDCRSLEGADLNHTEDIDDYAFKNCNSLKNLDLGDSLIEIGIEAFMNDISLMEITIPDSTQTIWDAAFYKCINVKKINLGKDLDCVCSNAFNGMLFLNEINYNCTNITQFSESFSEVSQYASSLTLNVGNNVEKLVLEGAFDFSNIDTINIGKNVKTIEAGMEGTHIKQINVDSENPYLYSYKNCVYDSDDVLVQAPTGLKSVQIKDGTTAIGYRAFYNSDITSITMPDSITFIDAYAFTFCYELKSIIFSNNITEIGFDAFDQCTKLKTLDLPENLEVIGNAAFFGCQSLASVIMNYNLRSIGYSAFECCDALRGIVIGENVKAIGQKAFCDCDKLEYVYMFDSSFARNTFAYSDNVVVYTMAGSTPYEKAREYGVPYVAYTDEDCFYDDVAAKLDVLAGYLGYCENGHGDIQWLTVYEADCDNDGYLIGVCEYCSEIIEERHINASGHDYELTAQVTATTATKGLKIYSCNNCGGTYCEYTNPTTDDYAVESHAVSGRLVVAQSKYAENGVTPAKGATISIDGEVLATTNENGEFSLTLDTGTYEATISYTYGFDRRVFIIVEDEDIDCGAIAVIGCDFNRDGRIDNNDVLIFNLTISSHKNDVSYLDFVDMNNDGYINAKDRLYIRACSGIDSESYQYPVLIIQK